MRRLTQNLQKVIFSDESWLCAEVLHLWYVRRFAGEVFSEEYSLKKTRFKGKKKVLVWEAISYTGPRCLYFIEEKENTDIHEHIFFFKKFFLIILRFKFESFFKRERQLLVIIRKKRITKQKNILGNNK